MEFYDKQYSFDTNSGFDNYASWNIAFIHQI